MGIKSDMIKLIVVVVLFAIIVKQHHNIEQLENVVKQKNPFKSDWHERECNKFGMEYKFSIDDFAVCYVTSPLDIRAIERSLPGMDNISSSQKKV